MPRKGKPQDSSPYDGIRGRWEAASLAQFLKLFQYKFNFACVTTQELEEALVDGGSVLIADTCARLLRFLTGSSDIIIGNFETHFKTAALESGSCPELTVLLGDQTWNNLGPEEKVLALKWLVDRVLEHRGEELKQHLDETWRPDDMRGLCAGQDAFNNVYWYLDDLRLYRENNVKKASKKDWECVCVTLQDWVGFLKQFRKTNNPQEKELYTYLNLELFPLIENQLRELGEGGRKGHLPNNEDLVKRERKELEVAASGAMIKESKEKRDKKNGSSVSPKVEPQPQECEEQLGGDQGAGGTTTATAAQPATPQPVVAAPQEVTLEEEGAVDPAPAEGTNALAPSADGEGTEMVGPATPGSLVAAATGSVEAAKDVSSAGPGSVCAPSVAAVDSVVAVPAATCVSVPEADMCSLDGVREGKPGESVLSDTQVLCDSVKTGETVNSASNHDFNNDHSNQPIGNLGVPMSTSTPGIPQNDGVQPLPSNVINKQPGTMEAQYMQQQSQIFVFSTTLANKAAESVLQGQFPSIIAYHCAQPGTKKYLEKHPLKMNQFIRQNPAQWLNNLAQMKQKGGPGNIKNLNSLNTPTTGYSGGTGPMIGEMSTGPTWSQSNSPITSMANINTVGPGGNTMMQTCANNVLTGCSVGSPMSQANASSNNTVVSSARPMKSSDLGSPLLQTTSNMGSGSPTSTVPNPASNSMIPSGQISPSLPPVSNALIQGPADCSPLMNSVSSSNPMMGHPQPSLTGVKVPDENLTPQQRQHREEQLATLRKMQQMLFPEHQLANPDGLAPGSNPCNQQGPMGSSGPQTMMSGPQGMIPGQQTMMVGQGSHGLRTSPLGDGSAVGSQKNMIMGQGVMPVGMGSGSNQGSPVGPAAQAEWQKLQQQFYEDRKKKVPSGSGNVPLGCGSPVIGGSPMGPGGTMCVSGPLSGPSSTGAPTPSSNVIAPGSVGQSGVPLGPGGPVGTPGGSIGVGPLGPRGMAPVRMHGPPPPYHQTTRSASVPTAMPSPTPNSPNNPTSNLSLPSPRASSGLHSPAEPSRHFQMVGNPRLPGPSPTSLHNTPLGSPNAGRPLNPSNPSTPLSAHPSPSTCRKDNGPNGTGDFPPSTQPSGAQSVASSASCPQPQVDGMFGRTLQSFAQQKQQQANQTKEPNLMPVPSPQQIQYLNTFEGQELTIQKQPNTSLGDTDIMSPTLTSNMDGSLPATVPDSSGPRLSGASTPLTPSSVDVSHRYGGPHTPHTPTEMNRFPIPSPHTPGPQDKCQRFPGRSPQSQGSRTPGIESCLPSKTSSSSVDGVVRFPSTSPQGGDGMGPPRFPGSSGSGSGTPGHPGAISTPPMVGNPGQQNFVTGPSNMPVQKGSSHFPEVPPPKGSADISPTGPTFNRSRPDNMPLDPDGNGGGSTDGKVSHFDPISSMAQMSQQLTSGVGGSPGQNGSLMGGIGGVGGPQMIPFDSSLHPGGGEGMLHCPPTSASGGPGHPGGHPGGGQFGPHAYGPMSSGGGTVPSQGGSGSPLMMAGGVSMMPSCSLSHSASPKSMLGAPPRGSPPMVPYSPPAMTTQRVQSRPPGPRPSCGPAPGPYNGANVQVKPSAPNTIQYLPARPQTNSGPRGPPSLEFLQRYANPLSNLDNKVPTHNLQYFPNNSQANNAVGGSNVPISMSGPMGPMGGMGAPMGGMMPGPQGPMCSQMGPSNMGSMNGPTDGQNSSVGHGSQMGMGMMGGPGGAMVGGGGQMGVPNNSSGGSMGVHGGGGGMQISGGPNAQMGNPMGGSSGPMSMGGGMGMGGPPGSMGGPIGGPMGVPGGPMSGTGAPMGMSMGGPVGSPMGGAPMGGPGGPSVVQMGVSSGPMVGAGVAIGVSGNAVGGPGSGMGGANGPMMGPNVSMSVVNGPMNTGMAMNPGGMGMGPMGVIGPLRGGPMGSQMGASMVGQPLGPRTHGAMMRGGPGPGMGGPMFGGSGQTVGNEQMFGPMSGGSGQMMPGAPNAQLFVSGAKSSPMGLGGAPDASQPLPPSMGPSGNFKSPPFIGPTTSDPNYAQQFHNFQQQLYATNTRSQMNNQAMTSNQSFFGGK
ncbi:protein BCL9 homolog [Hetaerina americana]|uniref:protein BCL9 homolog n=1 Tax=Hetaerina americana TaxID=62018 RepID=UPI003A7F2826